MMGNRRLTPARAFLAGVATLVLFTVGAGGTSLLHAQTATWWGPSALEQLVLGLQYRSQAIDQSISVEEAILAIGTQSDRVFLQAIRQELTAIMAAPDDPAAAAALLAQGIALPVSGSIKTFAAALLPAIDARLASLP